MGTSQARRGDTRRRIQDVALELFVEHGYEGTSLREIAERLDVTKAALYYHFKTKEDILVALVEAYAGSLDELVAWGRARPRDLETRRELLRRYSLAVAEAAPLFTFLHENEAALRELTIGQDLKERLLSMWRLVMEPASGADLADQARCVSALLTVHFGGFAMRDVPADPEEKRKALLAVADGIISGTV